MAATTISRTYANLLTFTFDNVRRKISDNVHKTTSVLWALTGGKSRQATARAVRYENGGAKIRIPMQWRKNATAKSVAEWETADTTKQEMFTSAFEDWGENLVTISVSRRELRMNSGPSGIFSLAEELEKAATSAIKEEVNRQLVAGTISGGQFIRGNSTADMVNLPMLVGRNGTVGGTSAVGTPGASIHGINPEVETWNKNQFVEGDGSMTYAEFMFLLNRLYGNCSRGGMGQPPNIAISDQYTHELYERILHVQARYGPYGADGVVSFGFKVLMFKNADWIWDEFVPDVYTPNADPLTTSLGTLWFLNTDTISFVIDQESDFVAGPFRQPHNQLAMYSLMVLMAQLTIEERRKNGIFTRIQHTIVS